MSMKSNDPREIALIRVKFEKVKALFKQKEVLESYQTVRDSESVKKYYQDMVEEIKSTCNNRLALEIIECEEVQQSNEDMIKAMLMDKAFNKLVDEGGGDFTSAIVAVITEENLKEAIDLVKDATLETINVFTGGLIGGLAMAVQIGFMEDVEDGEEE